MTQDLLGDSKAHESTAVKALSLVGEADMVMVNMSLCHINTVCRGQSWKDFTMDLMFGWGPLLASIKAGNRVSFAGL